MAKTFSRQIDKKIDVSFSSIILFYRVFGCFSAMGVQKHNKKSCRKVFKQKIVSNKSGQKIQIIGQIYFSRYFSSRFWAFLGEGRSKTPQENIGGEGGSGPGPGPGPFLASDLPTTTTYLATHYPRPTGVPVPVFLAAPWPLAGPGPAPG
jgi:hypothetical protein